MALPRKGGYTSIMTHRRPQAPARVAPCLVLLLSGCVDNKLHTYTPGGAVEDLPAIQLSTDALLFPTQDPGGEASDRVTVTNVGSADLHVSDWHIEGSGSFSLPDRVRSTLLEPGGSFDIEVAFSPFQAEEHASLTVESDDLSNPAAYVSLDGTGAYPQVQIVPDPYSFGSVLIGCSLDVDFEIQNVGLAPLTVDSVVPVGAGFALSLATPLTLEPGESAPFTGTYTAASTASAEALVYVTSNDPRGLIDASWSGSGSSVGTGEDSFRQGSGTFDAIDLFVYVDQSGSMDDDQANLGANAALLTGALEAASLDWQLMVVNDDSGCSNSGILTPETPGAEEAFARAVTRGGGSWTEAGLTIGVNGLQEAQGGGCNEGFLREGARTVLMLVSDEPEQSRASWDNRVNDILSLATTSVIVAVVGDLPRGCGSAEAGNGYAEAAVATGGELLSICAADWGSYAESLATLGTSDMQSTFALSSVPMPETIVVTVTGAVDTGWRYDENTNAIVWPSTNLPPAGSMIEVTYSLAGSCEQ